MCVLYFKYRKRWSALELKIEYLPKEDLKPYEKNAKLHPAEQIEQIKNSIREFGFNDPIAIWHENEIIEGHGRLLAALDMPEIETVPVIRLDDLTDEQRRAYMLAHNKLTMNTDFDFDLLSAELSEITNIDMSNFGFDSLTRTKTMNRLRSWRTRFRKKSRTDACLVISGSWAIIACSVGILRASIKLSVLWTVRRLTSSLLIHLITWAMRAPGIRKIGLQSAF